MRVALCISGFMRSYSWTFPNLEKFFLEEYNPDVFIHTWNWIDHFKRSVLNEDHVKTVYSPKKLVIEQFPMSFPMTETLEKVNYRYVPGLQSMYYKIDACNELKKQYEKKNDMTYDVVIRFRSDLQLFSPFSLEGDMNRVHIPTFGDFGGLNDQVAYSNSENIDNYSNLYHRIPEYAEEMPVNPEKFLKHHLEKQKIEVERFPLEYKIMRNQKVLIDNEIREKKMGFIR